jgi:hypothetical protein
MRSLRSYLLLPRPKDAFKWWILPLAFGLGALAEGGATGERLARAALAWAVLELLVYQARYQWNDIRGFAADQRHPDAAQRGRLPGPAERGASHIRASAIVAAARVAAALGLAALPGPLGLGWLAPALVVAVFGVAVLYEALRARATGRSGQVPPPLTPAIAGLWAVVGGGYAIRGVAGLGLAIDLSRRPALAVAALVTMWAFGIAFVTGRWCLEALAFARADGRRLTWSAEAGHAREHSLALARWLPPLPAGASPDRWRPLHGQTRFGAPWNVAVVVAAAAAGAMGVLLAGATAGAAVAGAAAGAGLLGAFVAASPRDRWLRLSAAAAVLGCGLALAGLPRPALAALPWLGIVAAHVLFCAQSLATLGSPLSGALRRERPRAGRPVVRHG